MTDVRLSEEQYKVLKGLVRIAAIEADDIKNKFPGNKKAEKEARIIRALNSKVFVQ